MAFVLSAFLALATRAGAPGPRRDAFVVALTVAGAWAAVGGEILSLGANLRFYPVLAWWAMPAVALGAFAFARRRVLRGWIGPVRVPDLATRVLLGATASLLLVAGLVALLTPPTTWDALTYHMPRQVYWMQQGSLAHYPANDLRQLEFPPMAESLGAQVVILAGTDLWSNTVGWITLLGCVLVVSVIARDLGGRARAQAISAFLVATYPVSLHHAVNPKNDLYVALWLCVLAWLGLRAWLDGTCGPARAAIMGLALGLLLYTKGTGYLFALPLGALLAVWMLVRLKARAIPAAAIIGLLGAALNAGHWWRNYDSFGHPMGATAAGRGYPITNETHTPAALLSNVVRNVTLHTALPSDRINRAQERWVARLHEGLGLDPSDPRTTTPPWRIFAVLWIPAEDEHAGAPVHALLAAIAPLALAAAPLRRRPGPDVPPRPPLDGALWGTLAAAGAMFLLFCFALKWQPWHSRLHLPVFALMAPVCGVLLPRMRGGLVKGLFLLAALVLAAVALLCNDGKPILGEHSILAQGREETLFQHYRADRQQVLSGVAAAAEFRPRLVGLETAVFGAEYAVQRTLLDRLKPPPHLAASRRGIGPDPPEGSPQPEVILSWTPDGAVMMRRPGPLPYVSVAQFPPITVFAREDLAGLGAGTREDANPFTGWRAVDGLAPPQGPFPDRGLPVVRWSTADRTRLEFDGTSADADLIIECQRGGAQHLEVLLNSQRVYLATFRVGRSEVTTHRIRLRPREGLNQLEFRYGPVEPTPRGLLRAVLFHRIQVLPRAAPGPPQR